MRVAKARANVTAQQLVVRVFIERNALCEKEMNQKKKIFRVYVVEKRTERSTPRIFFKNLVLWDKTTTHTTETHTEHILNI